MKKELHPEWYPNATVICQCGNEWTTGATVAEIRTEICSNCHPFYTGEQRIVDTEGRVDKFMKRLERRDELREELEAKEKEEAVPLTLSIKELGLSGRFENVLEENGITEVGHILDLFEDEGDEGITDISGLGAQALIDIKKGLRNLGFELKTPTSSEEAQED